MYLHRKINKSVRFNWLGKTWVIFGNIHNRGVVFMEKLLDFKKRRKDDDASKLYRFQCDCLSADDAMDIDVEETSTDKKFIIIRMDFESTDFWNRLRYAWQIVRGHWGWREFVVREEDFKDLSDIFNPDKKYSELV